MEPSVVGLGAVEPHLRRHSLWWRYVPHLHHRLGKVPPESITVGTVPLHEVILQASTAIESLIGVEETPMRNKVPVVSVVELHGRQRVEWRLADITGGALRRTHISPGLPEGGVDGVLVVTGAVDAVSVVIAGGHPDRVRAGERGHVAGVEAELPEHGDESAEVIVRAGEAVGGGFLVGGEA